VGLICQVSYTKKKGVAEAALFLATDDSGYITGIPMPVDGGPLASAEQPAQVNGQY